MIVQTWAPGTGTAPSNGFAVLVSREEADGGNRLWPGRPASLCEAEIAARLEMYRNDLEVGRWFAHRHIEVLGAFPNATYRRGWSWRPAVGTVEVIEWIDAAHAPQGEVVTRPWPRKPAPTTAADRMGRAA